MGAFKSCITADDMDDNTQHHPIERQDLLSEKQKVHGIAQQNDESAETKESTEEIQENDEANGDMKAMAAPIYSLVRDDGSENDNDQILSLSDDESEQEETLNMVDVLKDQVNQKGWAQVSLALITQKCNYLVTGYARQEFDTEYILPSAVVDLFRLFFPISKLNVFCWDNKYLTIQSGGKDPSVYVVKKLHWALSTFIKTVDANSSDILALDKVPPDTLKNVVVYMAHHKGVEPDPLPSPVRSIHMAQIVSDQWDATFIDAFDKKTIFEIILAANYLGIKSLLNLGCAKIATLIKQLDQTEINRIIDEEERYQREHAAISPSNPDGQMNDGH